MGTVLLPATLSWKLLGGEGRDSKSSEELSQGSLLRVTRKRNLLPHRDGSQRRRFLFEFTCAHLTGGQAEALYIPSVLYQVTRSTKVGAVPAHR